MLFPQPVNAQFFQLPFAVEFPGQIVYTCCLHFLSFQTVKNPLKQAFPSPLHENYYLVKVTNDLPSDPQRPSSSSRLTHLQDWMKLISLSLTFFLLLTPREPHSGFLSTSQWASLFSFLLWVFLFFCII